MEKGLPPIYTARSKVLILGTFPSQESRTTQSYYANNRNRFWKTICDILGKGVPNIYEEKVKMLKDYGIAVWDLIYTCEIDGSSDSAIKNPTFNNLTELLKETQIGRIVLNGKEALKMYEKIKGEINLPYMSVPSTSPANAQFNDDDWFEALNLSNIWVEKVINRYIELIGKSSLYRVEKTPDGQIKYIFDDYALGRACVECGRTRRELSLALIKEIEQGNL